MAEGQLKRIQPDIVEEVEKYEGGSFSEKLRCWKQANNASSNDLLTEIEGFMEDFESKGNADNNLLTVDDVDEVVREALDDKLPAILREMNQGIR